MEHGEEADAFYESPLSRARVVKAGAASPCLQILVKAVIRHTPETFVFPQG